MPTASLSEQFKQYHSISPQIGRKKSGRSKMIDPSSSEEDSEEEHAPPHAGHHPATHHHHQTHHHHHHPVSSVNFLTFSKQIRIADLNSAGCKLQFLKPLKHAEMPLYSLQSLKVRTLELISQNLLCRILITFKISAITVRIFMKTQLFFYVI